MTELLKCSNSQSRWKHIWVRGFVLGIGVVLIGFLVWFLIRETPSSPPSHTGEKAGAAQVQPGLGAPTTALVVPKVPAESTPTLKSQLEQVLVGIRMANQNKDLSQFLSHYSPNFPQLPQRAQSISRIWKIYDYPKMDFDLQEVRLLPDKTAAARVTWHVEAHNISTKKSKDISKSYQVRFIRESGQWRIKALDKAE
jgi:hypothetical protein